MDCPLPRDAQPVGSYPVDQVRTLIGALLCHQDEAVRLMGVEALALLGDACAVDGLVTALKDTAWQVRAAAAKALGTIDDPHTIRPLIATLRDPEPQVRLAVMSALSRMSLARGVCSGKSSH